MASEHYGRELLEEMERWAGIPGSQSQKRADPPVLAVGWEPQVKEPFIDGCLKCFDF